MKNQESCWIPKEVKEDLEEKIHSLSSSEKRKVKRYFRLKIPRSGDKITVSQFYKLCLFMNVRPIIIFEDTKCDLYDTKNYKAVEAFGKAKHELVY